MQPESPSTAGRPPRPEEALRPLMPALHALALARLRNTADAEDAVQEIVLRVLENLDSWRPEGPFEHWVFVVAANHVRNLARRRKIREEWSAPPDTEPEPGPAETLQAAEDVDRIRRALRTLAPEEIAPVLLHYVHGLPPKEVARHLDLTVEHFRVRLFRTLRKIRRSMEEQP